MRLQFMLSTLALALAASTSYANADVSMLTGRAQHPLHVKQTPDYMYTQAYGMTPAQMKKAYGLNLVAAQGKGQTIAIIDAYDHPNIESDLAYFNATFNLPACTTASGCFKKIYASGTQPTVDAGWALEIALDVEWAHAMAPLANIYLVEAKSNSYQDLYQAVVTALNNGATIISMSWGGPEFSSQVVFDNLFRNANATFFASSGDSGNQSNYPAASPYVVAVGGTTLYIDSQGNRLSETAWAGSGGGLSALEFMPTHQATYPLPNNPQMKRGIPDVAMNADPNTGVAVYNTVPYQSHTGWFVVGGTSASAPEWAALAAVGSSIVRQTIPHMETMFYKIAKRKYSWTYNDILTGSNGSCDYYCQARSGYDYVTGLGTPQSVYLLNVMIKEVNGV